MKVFVRVRPFTNDETVRKLSTNAPFEVSQDATQLHLFQDDKGHAERTFNFDHVFKMEDNNVTVSWKFLSFIMNFKLLFFLCNAGLVFSTPGEKSCGDLFMTEMDCLCCATSELLIKLIV